MSVPTTIILVEDHEVTRIGFACAIQALLADCVVLTHASLASFEAGQTEGPMPDIVIVDLGLPDCEPLDIIERVRSMLPAVPLVVFSANEDPLYLFAALSAGAKGYILKGASAPVLVQAIKLVLGGDFFISAQLLQQLFATSCRASVSVQQPLLPDHREIGAISTLPQLTARREEVAALLAKGLSNKEIGTHLGISLGTAKNYVRDLIRMYRVRSRQEIIAKLINRTKQKNIKG